MPIDIFPSTPEQHVHSGELHEVLLGKLLEVIAVVNANSDAIADLTRRVEALEKKVP